MTARATDRFRIANAKRYVATYGSSSYYLTIGKQTPWPDDSAPPSPDDSFTNRDVTYWDDVIGAERIAVSDITHAIPRHDWESGTVYDQYDAADGELYTKSFYVLTTRADGTYNVYKVLSNNSGAASVNEPTNENVSGTFTTADGYQWKYMYKISAPEAATFLNTQFIPVKTLTGDDGSDQWDIQQNSGGGHGADPILELGGFYVLHAKELEFDESGTLTVDNDYRNVAILKDPYEYGTVVVATDPNIRQTFKWHMNTLAGEFEIDELVTQSGSGATARVVDWDTVNDWLYVNNVSGVPVYGGVQTVTGGTSGATGRISTALVDTDPGFEVYSGEFYYIENRRPIQRVEDQTERIKIIIQF